jgi:para-aminobenzoate synthetase/4-amino-4-deoxychorismate lyase
MHSADYAGFPVSLARIRSVLNEAVAGQTGPVRVRLLLNADGQPRTEVGSLADPTPSVRVGLAAHPIDPANPFLFHKTTNRAHLERERRADCDDTVFWNPDRWITETTIANIVVQIEDVKVTPAVEYGLLPGTLRAELLARGEIVEGRISIEQLYAAPRFWLINSVRGWYDAVLVHSPSGYAPTS